MKDFFEEPAAMVEQDNSRSHYLVIEAKAELNTAEKTDAQAIAVYRSVGQKFLEIRSLKGRGSIEWIAKHAKISTKQVSRYIALAELPEGIDSDTARAVLWGNTPKPSANGSGGPKAEKSVVAFNRTKLFAGFNRFTTMTKAFARERGLLKDPDYLRLAETAESAITTFKALEKKAAP